MDQFLTAGQLQQMELTVVREILVAMVQTLPMEEEEEEPEEPQEEEEPEAQFGLILQLLQPEH